MALVLALETATRICSVALTENGKQLAIRESMVENSHSSMITIFVEEVLKEAGKTLSDIDAVAVSSGPGSYTGLRIGVSTAKGLSYSLEKPLIAVETLHAMSLNAIRNAQFAENAILCPMIDARRMEVYSSMFDVQNERITKTDALIIDENSFEEYKDKQLYIFGDGAEKCQEALTDAIYLPEIKPSALTVALMAEDKYAREEFEDVAYFEPFYLKDFVAGAPKVKGLR